MRHRIAALAIAGALALSSTPAIAKKVHGAHVLDESRPVGDDRFQSMRDWDRTLRFFRSVYGKTAGVVWRRVDTTPKVKAIHIENTRRGQGWEGINIYETDGKIFVYVIREEPVDAKKK